MLNQDALAAARRFADSAKPLIGIIREAVVAFESLSKYMGPRLRPDIQPAVRYALAGHPYGHNRRGKKRWLLEMKHQAGNASL